MPALQPTKSDMWIRSAATTESAFQLWYQWINTVSTHWVIVAGFGTLGSDGFIIRHAAGDITSRYLFRRNVNNLEVLVDPAGTVSLADGSDASIYASPLQTVFTIGTTTVRNEWQFHDWDDYLSIYNVDRSIPICDMPVNIQIGYGIVPSLLSDPTDGLTGQFIFGGDTVSLNGTGAMLTSTASSPSLVRVSSTGTAADWVSPYGSISIASNNPMGASSGTNLISNRKQPHVACCMIKPSSRIIGFYKYLYLHGIVGQPPGNVLINAGVSKFQYVWETHSAAGVLVVPIQNNFDPAAGPTNV